MCGALPSCLLFTLMVCLGMEAILRLPYRDLQNRLLLHVQILVNQLFISSEPKNLLVIILNFWLCIFNLRN